MELALKSSIIIGLILKYRKDLSRQEGRLNEQYQTGKREGDRNKQCEKDVIYSKKI